MLQYLTFFFLFTYPPTTQIYTLSLHDALPISDLTDDRARLVEAPRVARAREREADALHRLLEELAVLGLPDRDRKSTRLNSSHTVISYAVFCLKKKKYKILNFIYNFIIRTVMM